MVLIGIRTSVSGMGCKKRTLAVLALTVVGLASDDGPKLHLGNQVATRHALTLRPQREIRLWYESSGAPIEALELGPLFVQRFYEIVKNHPVYSLHSPHIV